MVVVIFRAQVRDADDEYSRVAARLRELALNDFGCLEFVSAHDGTVEIALSYWPDEASVAAWKREREHVLAQELGRERWYERYVVEVAEITRAYRWSR
ncbi:MAG: antibiotic biosynthesis monooxygenase [Myxococcota bacterium]|jgi:heme-degrading monooxygenase HmoA|nr:antibiotic biosynthesis monooxygenase [Myxococcota bacterium]